MAEQDPESVGSETRPVIEAWPTRGDVAQVLGISVQTVRRWQEEKRLSAVRDDMGVWRFDPAEIELQKAAQSSGIQLTTVDTMATHALDAARIQSESVSKNERHIEKLLSLVIEPSEASLMLLKNMIAELRLENAELRAKNFEMLEHFENSITQAHERAMHEKQVDAGIRRKDMAIQMLTQNAPMILSKLMGPSGEMPPQISAILSLVQGLTSDQILALLSIPGFLSDEQKAALHAVLTPDQIRAVKDAQQAAGTDAVAS